MLAPQLLYCDTYATYAKKKLLNKTLEPLLLPSQESDLIGVSKSVDETWTPGDYKDKLTVYITLSFICLCHEEIRHMSSNAILI